jgi:hypothetical protein
MKHRKIPRLLLKHLSDHEFKNELSKFEKFRTKVNEYDTILIEEYFNRFVK